MWPLALVALVREPPNATAWSRVHVRQAVVFGLAAIVAALIVLALPLVVVLAIPQISTTAVVWIYAVGLLVDVAGAAVLARIAFRYRGRALRGEIFRIPLITPLADRLVRGEP